MNSAPSLSWPVVLGLGSLALVRPLVSIVEHQLGVTGPAAVPIALTALITAIWVAVVGLSQVARPLLTLVAVGLTYGVLSIVLSGVVSVALTGQLQGPLAMPIAIVPVLVVNAIWGSVAGGLAVLVRRLRRTGNRNSVSSPATAVEGGQ